MQVVAIRARPYGFLGLAVSSVLILVAATALCILVALLALAGSAAVLGWQPMLERLSALRDAAASDALVLPRAGVVLSIVAYAAISATVLLAARFRGGRQWRDLVAWHPWRLLLAPRLFWLIGAATIAYSFAADAVITRYYPASKDWVTLPKGPVWVGLFVFLAVVMAPLTEELMFRGWLYTGLRAKIGVSAAILVTSVLFALAHWEKSHLYALAVFPVGLVLGYFREHADSLMASMTFHAIYNGAALATLALGW